MSGICTTPFSIGTLVAIGHVAEIAEEALERDLLLLRRQDVQGREIAGAEIRRMRHAGGAALLRRAGRSPIAP